MNYCICCGLAVTRKRLKMWFFWHGTYTHIHSDCKSCQMSFSYQKYSVFQERGFAAEKNNYLKYSCDYSLDSNHSICSSDPAQVESMSNDKC